MSEDYEADAVGYKHPPRANQFRPGQSGNPSGRPKGTRNFRSELREELGELITVRDGDREIQLSKQRALIKSLVGAAIDGASVEERTDPGLMKEKIRVDLQRFFRKRSGLRPFVLPVIMEI